MRVPGKRPRSFYSVEPLMPAPSSEGPAQRPLLTAAPYRPHATSRSSLAVADRLVVPCRWCAIWANEAFAIKLGTARQLALYPRSGYTVHSSPHPKLPPWLTSPCCPDSLMTGDYYQAESHCNHSSRGIRQTRASSRVTRIRVSLSNIVIPMGRMLSEVRPRLHSTDTSQVVAAVG